MPFGYGIIPSIDLGDAQASKENRHKRCSCSASPSLLQTKLYRPEVGSDLVRRTSTRDLLREYLSVHLSAVGHDDLLGPTKARSEGIHAEPCSIVEDTFRQEKESAAVDLFVDSINQVVDIP